MKEEEIRPKKIFDKYLSLSKNDIEIFFKGKDTIEVLCPACGKDGEFMFKKDSFSYKECKDCKTLYVSPRPKKDAFNRYYMESESSKYWATTFYKVTQEARREKLWKPKAKMVMEKLSFFSPDSKYIVDIGGGYGIFAEEFKKISPIEPIVVEPSSNLAQICRDKGLTVVEKFLENMNKDDLPSSGKSFVSFELFEHLYSPKEFLVKLKNIINSGDVFIFTTLSSMGIDIQVLWDKSKSISPPHHLNFLNPKSIKFLLCSLDFEVLEITTPGKLDLDIIENNKNFINDRFWKAFIDYGDNEDKVDIQQCISKNLFSSHMMIVCRKL